MSGPSGRSPFPGRSRRQQMMDESNSSGSSFASTPLMMNSILSQSRLSPAAAWSPMNTSGRRNSRRFFDQHGNKDGGGVLGTAIPPASMGTKQAPDDSSHEMMDLTQIRAMTRNAILQPGIASSPSTAVFFGSILYTKTQSLQDAHLYAQALALNGEYMRAVKLLERAGLFSTLASVEQRLEAVLLAAQSLITLGDWTEALQLLETSSAVEDDDEAGWLSLVASVEHVPDHTLHPMARLCLLRGKAYEETSNPVRACAFYKRALRIDANTVEALDLLIGRNMVTPHEAHDLVSALNIETEWMRDLYLARIPVVGDVQGELPPQNPETPHNAMPGIMDASSIQMATPSLFFPADENTNQKLPAKVSIPRNVHVAFEKLWTVHQLEKNPQALALAAIKSFRNYQLQDALDYCQELNTIDPLCPLAVYVYIATLVALQHKRLLFQLAHEWVEASPKSAHAWFAVGAYYYACGRYHVAQRHFCRATRLEPQCCEAWIAFGCSFALCDESDQALASFRAAQRLAPAHYIPLLYMGMEYLRTNHVVLARHFLMAAYKQSGGDALCLHELGVADYKRGEYATAGMWFHRALVASAAGEGDNPVELCQDVFWEPTLFNLGQCYRKNRQFEEAEQCFEKCLALCPGNASCFSALAFTKHLSGDIDGAIELYHQALSRKPDDPLCSGMLNRALKEALATTEELVDSSSSPKYASSPTKQSSSKFLFSPQERRRSARIKNRSIRQDLDSDDGDSNPDLSLDSDDDVDMSMS